MTKQHKPQIPMHLSIVGILGNGLGAGVSGEFSFLTFPLEVHRFMGVRYNNIIIIDLPTWDRLTEDKRREWLINSLIRTMGIIDNKSKERLSELFNIIEDTLHAEILINALPLLGPTKVESPAGAILPKLRVLK